MPHTKGIVILSVALLAGCYAPRRIQVVPLPVRLVSPSEFQLVLTEPDRPAASCRALRAELDVRALRGDTLHFANATVLKQAPGATPCTQPGAGFVVITDHPDLRAETLALDGARGVAATVGLIVAVPLLSILLLGALWSGT